jgi:hypothetical protein
MSKEDFPFSFISQSFSNPFSKEFPIPFHLWVKPHNTKE